ncbi:hypothetical protein TCON_2442 [Astathelohania contejeani]|uniref:Uncharacterized protein n=1 Tax=Astathelohania contejeani TaxID=164912 RepID=A0ABQ7HW13_9MICR|nr:hypothetical protein TCON_2442 [Thelohania contejeani]
MTYGNNNFHAEAYTATFRIGMFSSEKKYYYSSIAVKLKRRIVDHLAIGCKILGYNYTSRHNRFFNVYIFYCLINIDSNDQKNCDHILFKNLSRMKERKSVSNWNKN